MKYCIQIFISLLLIASCQTKQKEQIDEKLNAYFDSSSIPAAIMGIIDIDGNTNWYSFGPQIWSDPATSLRKDHIFRIFSMTKPIASVAALQLVERGLIGLDDPLNNLMPEMASIPILDEDGTLYHSDLPITLRHLLTHTSGFAQVHNSERLANFQRPENWPYEDGPRIFKPGTDWRYGTSLDWVGKVIEKVSGQDLETYLRENITGPLEMNCTWFNVPGELQDSIASRGNREASGKIVEWSRIPEIQTYFSAGGGLFGSPADYLKFLHCILNFGAYDGGRILEKETVEMMFTDNLPDNVNLTNGFIESDRFGIGWAIRKYDNDFIVPIGAVYWAGVANTYFMLDPYKKIAIVYFSNYFPFLDEEAHGFYKLFIEEVYYRI